MPRRKKLPVPKNPNFTGLGRNDKDPQQEWLINKTKPLTTLSQTSMTLPEFKIFDAYLSRIDCHKPDERYVRFEKGELEQLLGVEKINKADLTKRLRNLFQTLEIHDERKPKGFTLIALFTKAECEQDEDGLWQVNLACSAEAMEYIFNPESLTYLKYRLKNVINLTSRYSYILFLYLWDNRWRKTWTIALAELKQLLNCTSESYNEFKLFNNRILKKCCNEINEKTDLKFEYLTVKKGRKIAAIKFTVRTLADELPEADPDQLTFDNPVVDEQQYSSDPLTFLAEACDNSFTEEEMQVIFSILAAKDLPAHQYGVRTAQYHYLMQQYSELKRQESLQKIKNRFLYFKAMLEKND